MKSLNLVAISYEKNNDSKVLPVLSDSRALNFNPNTPPIPSDQLPYSEIYTETYLKEKGKQRNSIPALLLRGDTRALELIDSFSPQYTNPDSTPREGTTGGVPDSMDIEKHIVSAKGSGLVSFTHSLGTAKGFTYSDESDIGYIYLIKGRGEIVVPPSKNQVSESEHAIPGGVDKEDIIAYREYNHQKKEFNGNLFISKDFMAEHPNCLQGIYQLFRNNDEYRPELAKMLTLAQIKQYVDGQINILEKENSKNRLQYMKLISAAINVSLDKFPSLGQNEQNKIISNVIRHLDVVSHHNPGSFKIPASEKSWLEFKSTHQKELKAIDPTIDTDSPLKKARIATYQQYKERYNLTKKDLEIDLATEIPPRNSTQLP